MNQRINPSKLQQMFEHAGLDKAKLHDALRTMGPKALKSKEMRENWTPEIPTWCTCYFTSEFVYYYVAPAGTIPYSLKVPGDPGTHRFLRWSDGTIIDLTCDQFPCYNLVDYSKAKVTYFMQTGCKGPSKRARELARLMGYDPDKWIRK